MSLLNPNQLEPLKQAQIHKVLKAASLPQSESREGLASLLDNNGLSKEDILQTVSNTMLGGDSSAVRLNAAKIGLEMHGMLKNNEGQNAPVVTIIIKDSEHCSINPILIPR